MRSGIVAIWALAGLLVAGGWTLYASAMAPHATESMRLVWVLATISCPILLAHTLPVKLTWILAANAATYALVGVTVEGFRSYRVHST